MNDQTTATPEATTAAPAAPAQATGFNTGMFWGKVVVGTLCIFGLGYGSYKMGERNGAKAAATSL